MKCFIAIPSVRDVEGGKFRRLGEWSQREAIIQIDSHAKAEIVSHGGANRQSALWIVSPFFLENETNATSLLLDNKKQQIHSDLAGIFFHPGITNTPGAKQIARLLESHRFLKPASPSIVAFTISGIRDYQVPCLSRVWNWLQQLPDGKETIEDAGLEALHAFFLRLMAQGRMDPLVRLAIRAQGILEGAISANVKEDFRQKLLSDLKAEKEWLLADPESKLVKAVQSFLDSDKWPENEQMLLTEFLDSARKYCEKAIGQSAGGCKS